MPKISKSIYLDWEVYQKLMELRKDYGSLGKVLENLIREHEQLKKQTELKEKTLNEKIEELKNEIINMKEIIVKIGKTWGVKV
jgi:predicted CopG family antitoxin